MVGDPYAVNLEVIYYVKGDVQTKVSFDGLAALSAILARKFTCVSEIPREFVQKNYELHGQVKHVTASGEMMIEHVPILNMRFLNWKSPQERDRKLLPVNLAGILLNDDAVQWLKKTAHNQSVWFRLLEIAQNSVESDVKIKKVVSLNEELIKQGMCSVKSFESPPASDAYNQFIIKLVALEHLAVKKEKGIWKESQTDHNWMKRNIVSRLKSLATKLKTIITRIKKKE